MASMGLSFAEPWLGWFILGLSPLFLLAFWRTGCRAAGVRRWKRLAHALDADSEGLALVDRQHVLLAVSNGFAALLGEESEDILGRNMEDVFGIQGKFDDLTAGLENALAGRAGSCSLSLRLARAERRELHVGFAPLPGRSSRSPRVAVRLRDETRERHAQMELREREALYNGLVEGARSIILRVTPEGIISFMNRFGYEFFGYAQEEVLGRHVLGLIVPEVDAEGRDLVRLWNDLLDDIDSFSQNENENIRKNGERVWVAWSNKAIRDQDGMLQEVLCVGNDMTRLRKSNREIEALYKALNQAGSGLVVTDLAGGIVYANPAWARLHGYESFEGVPGHTLGEVLDAGSGELPVLLAEARDAGLASAELLHVRKDGSSFVGQTSLTLLTDPAGKPDGFVVMVTDASESRRLLSDLQRNRQRLEAIVGCLTDLVFGLDDQGRFTYLSPAVKSIFGYDPEEVLGHSFDLLTHPDDLERCQEYLRTLLAEDPTENSIGLRGLHRDGSVVHLLSHPSVMRDPVTGRNIAVGVARDMTERVRMMENLNESRGRFDDLVSAIEEAFWLQSGTQLLYVSPGFEALFGLSAERFMSDAQALRRVVLPEDAPLAERLLAASAARTAEERCDVTLRVSPPGGKVRWVRGRTFPIVRNGQVERVAGVAQDVTAYTEAVQDMEQARDVAERANKSKSAFLSRIGHEFRTPLNGVLGMLQLLALDPGLGEKALERVRDAEMSGQILLQLLDRLLEYVAVESCRGRESEQPFSLHELLEGLQGAHGPAAAGKGLDLVLESSGAENNLVGDAARIRRTLDMLLENAIRFTPAGMVRLRVFSEEEPDQPHRLNVVFLVEDAGPGIPEKMRVSVFEPFVQGDESYTRRFGGIGLGLSLVRRLVRCLDGNVDVGVSELGGALFRVELPLGRALL
ncbi:MAG: PAS domain S-box protein [Desulfovibrionaceae bacterium]